MSFSNKLACTAMLGLLLSACATRPREFNALVNPAPADSTAYLRDYATCRLFVNSKFRNNGEQKAATLAAGYLTGGLIAPFVAKGIRSSRENKWKQEMAGCLNKYGHNVCDWQPLKISKASARRSATKSRSTKPDPCTPATEQQS
jgi:hypothetical protein